MTNATEAPTGFRGGSHWRAALAGGGVSTVYGLAVALDRSHRGALALDFIRSQGLQGWELFRAQYNRHAIFFVPEGEVEYYFALRAEPFGEIAEAVDHWKAFIRSGAHPQFQPRAKEHLDALLLRRNFKIDVPIISPDGGREPLITPQRRGRP